MRNLILGLFMLLPLFTKSVTTINPETFWDHVTYGSFDIPEITVKPVNENDVNLLARLLFSEAGLEPMLGILYVGNVVTNRMEDKGLPLEDIVFRPGQFDGIHTEQFRFLNAKCVYAARLILRGYRLLPKQILYYSNPCGATDDEHQETVEPHVYVRVGNHAFYWNPKYKGVRSVHP